MNCKKRTCSWHTMLFITGERNSISHMKMRNAKQEHQHMPSEPGAPGATATYKNRSGQAPHCSSARLHLRPQVLHCPLGHWHKLVLNLHQQDAAVHMGAQAGVRVMRGPGVHHGALHALCGHPVPPKAPATALPHPLVWPQHIDAAPQVERVIDLVGVSDLWQGEGQG